MQTLSNQVFSEKQIVTSSLISKGFKCNIDEANKMMYEFYQKNKDNLEAYFIIVRKDGDVKIVIDRITEQRLNYLLYDQEYSSSIISLKIWAVYDKSQGELEVSNIYEVEDADLHCIENLCYNMRDLDLKKAEYQAKRAAATPAKPSQASAKKPQAANNTTEKPKLATQTSGKVTQESAKRANMAEVTAKSHEAVKKMGTLEEEFHAKPEEPAKTNQKKRKGDAVTPMAEAVGQDKELKKAKMTKLDSFEQKEPVKEKPQAQQKLPVVQQQIQQKPQVQQPIQKKSSKIEVEEEESYYPDDSDVMKVEKEKEKEPVQSNKLQRFPTYESKKSFNTQSSLSDPFDEPSPPEGTAPVSNEPISQETDQPEFIQVKRVRKVPRERTYMDEKGYLIVEKEFIDEEYYETVRNKPAAAKNPANASSNDATSSKKKAPEKGQATLASFFRKK